MDCVLCLCCCVVIKHKSIKIECRKGRSPKVQSAWFWFGFCLAHSCQKQLKKKRKTEEEVIVYLISLHDATNLSNSDEGQRGGRMDDAMMDGASRAEHGDDVQQKQLKLQLQLQVQEVQLQLHCEHVSNQIESNRI